MKISKTILACFFVLTSALSVYFFSKSNSVDMLEHDRYYKDIIKFQGTDSSLNKNILKIRYRLLDYYDVLVSDFSELKMLQSNLSSLPPFIDEVGEGEINQVLNIISGLTLEKGEVLERFKSKNAILKNSVRYIPSAVRQSVENLSKNGAPLKMAIQLEKVLRDTLEYTLNPHDELAANLQSQLDTIKNSKDQYYKFADKPQFNESISHIETILSHTSVVNSLTETLLWVPIWQWGNTLALTYNRHQKRSLDSIKSNRLYLYICASVLFIFSFIMIIFYKDYRERDLKVESENYSNYSQKDEFTVSTIQGNEPVVGSLYVDNENYK